MLILAIDSSAKAASAALCRDEELVAQYYQNSGQTHSRTLMPMLEAMLKNCDFCLEDVDYIACAIGPGSFTGLRIGVAMTKGLCWGTGKLCCGVSTLEAIAWNMAHQDGIICPVMDARRNQVYNALFRADGGILTRLCPDRAIGIDELKEDLKKFHDTRILVGDGAKLCYNAIGGERVRMAPPHLIMQSAWGVAMGSLEKQKKGQLIPPDELVPTYLRLPQAERERLEKEIKK